MATFNKVINNEIEKKSIATSVSSNALEEKRVQTAEGYRRAHGRGIQTKIQSTKPSEKRVK